MNRVANLAVSWARSILPTISYSLSLTPILIILHSKPRLRLQIFGFLSFRQPSRHAFFLYSTIRATFPAHLILLPLITLTIISEQHTLRSSSLCSFFLPPVTCAPLHSQVRMPSSAPTPFSNTLSFYSPHHINDGPFFTRVYVEEEAKLNFVHFYHNERAINRTVLSPFHRRRSPRRCVCRTAYFSAACEVFTALRGTACTEVFTALRGTACTEDS